MAIITKPSARDPRFIHDGTAKAPAEQAREAATAAVLRCGRGPCGAQVPVGALSPEQRARYAETLGFVRGEGEKGHILYCSKLCREQDCFRLDAVCACPTCRLRVDGQTYRPGHKVCSGPTPRPAEKPTIQHVRVRDVTDRQGRLHRAVVCDRWACESRHYVDPNMSAERIAAFAAASGFVETAHGTVCGPSCARQLQLDVAAGRQDPLELSKELESEMAAAGKLPAGAVRAVPSPAPAASLDAMRAQLARAEERLAGLPPDGDTPGRHEVEGQVGSLRARIAREEERNSSSAAEPELNSRPKRSARRSAA